MSGPLAGLLAALLLTAAASASAFPVGHPEDPQEALRLGAAEAHTAADVDFTAIVALSNCSGALVRFTTSNPDDRSMALTNGHCVGGFIAAGDAVVGKPSTRSFTLLSAGGRFKATLRASELMYATMTGTAIALYRLTKPTPSSSPSTA